MANEESEHDGDNNNEVKKERRCRSLVRGSTTTTTKAEHLVEECITQVKNKHNRSANLTPLNNCSVQTDDHSHLHRQHTLRPSEATNQNQFPTAQVQYQCTYTQREKNNNLQY